MVSKLDEQTYTSEFESHWVPLSYGLVPHLSKKLSKLPLGKGMDPVIPPVQQRDVVEGLVSIYVYNGMGLYFY